jgi:hypothetical protein
MCHSSQTREHDVTTAKQFRRREFLKFGLKAGGSVIALGAIPITLIAQNDKVSEDEPLAQAMGYVHDATKADVAKYPKRAGEAGAKQFCNNCALYAGSAADEWAACSIFQNRLVAGPGWCNAWVAKS